MSKNINAQKASPTNAETIAHVVESEKNKRKALNTVGRVAAVFLVTVLLIVIALGGVLLTVFKGPSESMRRLVTLSFNETSALKWVPGVFMPEDVVAAYVQAKAEANETITNTSLIKIDQQNTGVGTHGYTENDQPLGFQETIYPSEDTDGDGIIIEQVTGPTYTGYMMIVLDPTRLFLGTPDTFTDRGLTIYEMYEKYDCVAAINGGGFSDWNGTGNGGTPDGMVVRDGKVVYGEDQEAQDMVGFDDQGILLVGRMTPKDCMDRHMQYGVHFGPSLIINGVPQNDSGDFFSGINPRTAIGQRSDGAVLMLVIDGRQIYSPGATLIDLVDVMLEYGAVNASNLDGGSSTMMLYNGELLNQCASVVGPRKMPTCFLVRPQE